MKPLTHVLGVDPGLRHTGWAIVANGKLGAHGLILTPGTGKLSVARALAFILPALDEVEEVHTPDVAAVEEVVWRGVRRKITMPLSHVAGAIVGSLVARGVRTYLLTPSMKAKKLPRLYGEWSDHEQDAARLALRVWTVLSAGAGSGRSKRSADAEQNTFAARLVLGLG